ncbi:MAG: hypothetical protein EPN93_15025 [Spirochaetes bacterium]|nr:MAG: hypothetical protein EPN93_15025 [Spirochaetota bacterium]
MVKGNSARASFKSFMLRNILATDGISYFVIIPLVVAAYLSSVTLSPEQVRAFIYTVGAITAVFAALNALWYRYLFAPFASYCGKYDRGEVIEDILKIRVRERFSSFNVLAAICITARWLAGFLAVSVSVNLISGISFDQLLNLWIAAAAVMTYSVIEYNFVTKGQVKRFSGQDIFRGLETVVSDRTRSFLGSITGQLAFASVLVCFIITLILTATAISVAHRLLEHVAREAAGRDIAAVGAEITEHSVELALWLTGMGVFWLGVGALILYKSMKDRLEPLIHYRKDIVIRAKGDFTGEPYYYPGGNEIGMLGSSTRILTDRIREIVSRIMALSGELAASSEEMSGASGTFSESAQREAANVEEITASMEEMSASIGNVASNTEDLFTSLIDLIDKMQSLSQHITGMGHSVNETFKVTQAIAGDVKSGEQSLMKMNATMQKVVKSSDDMMSIVNIINDISDRINLLSLNASIEAARAGDAGRGFAVVAEQISKLADQTAQSIGEITSLITMNKGEISGGLKEMLETTASLGKIIEGVNRIENGMEQINLTMDSQIDTNSAVQEKVSNLRLKSENIKLSTGEQKIAVYEITQSMTSIYDITNSYAAGAEQIAGSSTQVAQMAANLKESVDFFKV